MKLAASVAVAALCAALWGTAGAASAQTYSRIVAFGDSLSDNGNLGPNFPYPSPPYYQQRFSNGPTWVEDLQGLNLPSTLGHGALGQVSGSTDWAFGGAETGMGSTPPGLQYQLGGYLLSGGTFGPHDLVTVWAGANDIFDNLPAAGANPNPTGAIDAVATNAATNVLGVVDTIAKAGAGTILVPNLPPLAQTPNFTSGPAAIAAPLALSGANTFNAALLAGLQAEAKANPGTNFILVDTNTMLVYDQLHGAQFGFTNTTQACVLTPSCVGASTSAQNGYLFWDGVHPTARTHQLLAEIVTDYATYGDRGAAMGLETESSVRHRAQTYDTALDRLQGRDFGNDRSGVGVALEYDDAQVDARGVVSATRDASETLRINLDHVASPTLRFGGLFSFANSDVNAGALKFRDQSASADAYMGWRAGRLFVNADAGVGLDDLSKIDRQTAVPEVVAHGSSQGWSAGLKLQAGTWFDLANGWTVSPRAALSYTRGEIDGYTESAPFDRYQYDANAISATALEGTVRLQGPLAGRVWAHLEGGYRGYLRWDGDPVRVTLADNVAQTLSRTLAAPDDGLALVDAGLGGKLFRQVKWDVSYRGRFGSGYDDNLAHAGLNLAF
jgi:outer membrane lipase/esterase